MSPFRQTGGQSAQGDSVGGLGTRRGHAGGVARPRRGPLISPPPSCTVPPVAPIPGQRPRQLTAIRAPVRMRARVIP